MLDCQERDRTDKIAMAPESPPHLENSAPRLAACGFGDKVKVSYSFGS